MELIEKTLGQCLHEQAKIQGEHLAVEADGQTWSFSRLDEISDVLAIQMKKQSIKKGVHVGIWSVNSPHWVFVFIALVKLGAVPVLINTCYRQEEMKGILNYSDVQVLYYGDGCKDLDYRNMLEQIKPELPKVKHFIPMEGMIYGTLAECQEEDILWLRQAESEVCTEDTACMIFTSGTTSLPKGVLLTHYNLINNARAMILSMHWGPKEKMCITVPLFHCFGITAGIVACVLGGMSMYLLSYFKTARVWDALMNQGCTILNGVPSMFLALIRKEQYKDFIPEGLHSGIIAGSPVSCEEFLEICRRFPNMHLQPSYGQTETSPCVTVSDWDASNEQKSFTAGKVIEHVAVRIADTDTGAVLKSGQDGEIQVKGYNIMKGYYNLPRANENVHTADGWLHTGDIGRLDDSGELWVTGRLKEMIIRAGENISPMEIENAIRPIAWVEAVKVVGVPAQVRQEEIAACIIPKEGCNVDKEELLSYLEPRLAHYKLPAYVLEFTEFPMNASGKINLKELRAMAERMASQVDAAHKAKKHE